MMSGEEMATEFILTQKKMTLTEILSALDFSTGQLAKKFYSQHGGGYI